MSGSLNNMLAKVFRPKSSNESGNSKAVVSATSCARNWFLGRVAVFQVDREALQYCFARHTIRGVMVEDFGKVYIPSALSDKDDQRAFVMREVRQALGSQKHTPDRIGLALDCSHSSIRSLRLPVVRGSELMGAVRFAGASQIPFAFDNACWDCRITDTIKHDAGVDIQALLIAVERERVIDTLSMFDELNIDIDFIHQDIDALGFALRRTPEFSEEHTYGLINVHRTRTDISIYAGSRLRFVSRGAMGSIAFGVGATPDMMPQLLDNFAEGLTLDIQNSLDYYGALTATEDIQRMYLYGDLSYSDDLVDNLRERLQLSLERFPIEVLAQQTGMPGELIQIAPTTMPVIASAIAGRNLCDLSLPERRQARYARRFKHTAAAATIVLALGLISWWRAERVEVNQAQEQTAQLQQQVSDFQNSPGYIGYRIVAEDIMRAQRELTQLTPAREAHHLALKEISALTLESIRLSYLEYFPHKSERRTQIAGVARTPETAPETQLAEFISRLEHSPLFANVTLLKHTKDISAGIRTVTFSIDMDALL